MERLKAPLMGANAASVPPSRQPHQASQPASVFVRLSSTTHLGLSMTGPRLLEQYREKLRVKHYSLRTEEAYLHWVRRFIYFHGKRHPRALGAPEVETFQPPRSFRAKLACHYRQVAFDRRAPHMAAVRRIVERRGAVLRAAVVPQHRVVQPPAVAVDEFRAYRELL